MKKIIFGISMTLVIMMCISYFQLTTFAAKKSIKGKVSFSLVIPKDEINEFKNSMDEAKKDGENYFKELIVNTRDKDKVEYLKKLLKNSQSINIDNIFENKPDGSASIDLPYGNVELYIDGEEIRTDSEGYFEFKSSEDKDYEIIISKENKKIEKRKIKFDKSKNNNEIKIIKSLDSLGEGIKRMGNEMEAEGQAITYYPKRAIGQTYGYGAGKSKIFKNTNIVGCNKHDKDYGQEITTAQFAARNSDCSKSVKLGLLSMASPTWPTLKLYPYSEYCVYESITTIEGSANAYCNGKTTTKNGTSKGTHINCSWFSGIGHSESFHTH